MVKFLRITYYVLKNYKDKTTDNKVDVDLERELMLSLITFVSVRQYLHGFVYIQKNINTQQWTHIGTLRCTCCGITFKKIEKIKDN